MHIAEMADKRKKCYIDFKLRAVLLANKTSITAAVNKLRVTRKMIQAERCMWRPYSLHGYKTSYSGDKINDKYIVAVCYSLAPSLSRSSIPCQDCMDEIYKMLSS